MGQELDRYAASSVLHRYDEGAWGVPERVALLKVTIPFLGLLLVGACSPQVATDAQPPPKAQTPIAAPPSATATPPVSEPFTIEQIAGEWRVAHVMVFKGENDIQATSVDDPAFMGQTLTISTDQVLWPEQGIGTAHDPMAGPYPCIKPRLTATGQTFGTSQAEMLKFGVYLTDFAPAALERPAYLIGCDFGDWDGATLSPQADGGLLMTWTDGAILSLRRNYNS